jgi:hypothetical protein
MEYLLQLTVTEVMVGAVVTVMDVVPNSVGSSVLTAFMFAVPGVTGAV